MTVVLGLMAGPAMAVPVTGMNLADPALGLGGVVASTGPNAMLDAADPINNPSHGTLKTTVQTSSGGYVYIAELDPSVEGVSSFQTTFLYGMSLIEQLPGFTGRAGWSFIDSFNAGGGTSGAFTIEDRTDDLIWRVAGFGVQNWSSETPIRFFFESTYAPGMGEYYFEMMNASVAFAQGLAPDPNARVPEPATLLLLASGLVAGGLWTRRARRLTA